MFKGKKILIGVTGGIAAMKVPLLVRDFQRQGAEVKIVMTRNAEKFVTPMTLEAISGSSVSRDIFKSGELMGHINLGREFDVIVVVPGTADFLSRYAYGRCDDLLMATLLAAEAKVVVFPSMNVNMWNNPLVQENVRRIRSAGVTVIDPGVGELACGMMGPGRLISNELIMFEVYRVLNGDEGLKGKSVLITAGATREYADSVRYISNGSSGKMARYVALVASAKGAEVTVVAGVNELEWMSGIDMVEVISGVEMEEVVLGKVVDCDVLLGCAAVCDYRFEGVVDGKISKRDENSLPKLCLNGDVLFSAGKVKRQGQLFVGFAMNEGFDEGVIRQKFEEKKMDLLVYNSLDALGAEVSSGCIYDGFNGEEFEKMAKIEVAERVILRVEKLLGRGK